MGRFRSLLRYVRDFELTRKSKESSTSFTTALLPTGNIGELLVSDLCRRGLSSVLESALYKKSSVLGFFPNCTLQPEGRKSPDSGRKDLLPDPPLSVMCDPPSVLGSYG